MTTQSAGWLKTWFKKKGFFLQLILLILAIITALVLQYIPEFLLATPYTADYSNTDIANVIMAIAIVLPVFLLFLFNKPKTLIIVIPVLTLITFFLISVVAENQAHNSSNTLHLNLLPSHLTQSPIPETNYSNDYPGFKYDMLESGYKVAITNQHRTRAISAYIETIKIWNKYLKITHDSFMSERDQITKINEDWQTFKNSLFTDSKQLQAHQNNFTLSEDELIERAELIRINLNTIFANFFKCTEEQSICNDHLNVAYNKLPPHLFLSPTPLIDFCHPPQQTMITNTTLTKINCPGSQSHIISILEQQIQEAIDISEFNFGYNFFTTEVEFLHSPSTINKSHRYLTNHSLSLPSNWTPYDSASFKNSSIAKIKSDSILTFNSSIKKLFKTTNSIPPFLSFNLFIQHPSTQNLLPHLLTEFPLSSINQPKDLLVNLQTTIPTNTSQDLTTIDIHTKFITPMPTTHPSFSITKIYFNNLLLNENYKYILGLLLFSLFIRLKRIFVLKV
jgi:hypothetical protein